MEKQNHLKQLFVDLENIIKSLASWKRLVIFDELSKYSEGRSYTELRKAVEFLELDNKSVRIDFHLEELRKMNFLKKDKTYLLFNESGQHEVYKLTHTGQMMYSFITSVLENQMFLANIPNEGLVYRDEVTFPDSLDLSSLIIVLDVSKEFERVQMIDEAYRYKAMDKNIQNAGSLNNLILTFDFIEQTNENDGTNMKIMAYWPLEAIEQSNYKKNSFMTNKELQNELISAIRLALSNLREIIYNQDPISAKIISDKIFEYINSDKSDILAKVEII